MTDKTTNIPLQEEESGDQTPSQKQKLTRRQALLGALLASAIVKPAEAATDGSCACLPAPDCNAVCPNGGVPRGDGTQACECTPAPNFPRALGVVDGGDAVKALNSDRWGGMRLRLNHNTTDTWIPVIAGDQVDYVLKSEIGGAGQKIGAKLVYGESVLETIGTKPGRKWYTKNVPAVKRDEYGRVEAVGYAAVWTQCNCNCSSNCCNCGDDSRCFIKARLKTTSGFKDVSEVKVGDRLVGLDGIHTVVGVLTGQLGKRKAVCPKGSHDVVLTEDHVVLHQGLPVVYSEKGKRMGLDILTSDSGIHGVYVQPWLDKLISVTPQAFDCMDLPEDTRTYTLFIADGHWGMTEDGTSVLLCQML